MRMMTNIIESVTFINRKLSFDKDNDGNGDDDDDDVDLLLLSTGTSSANSSSCVDAETPCGISFVCGSARFW